MSDERWFQIRRKRNIELVLCLLVVLPMFYGLWFQLAFLSTTCRFCFWWQSSLQSTKEFVGSGLLLEKNEREKAWLCYNK